MSVDDRVARWERDPRAVHESFLPAPLLAELDASAEPHPAVPGLRVARGYLAEFPAVEAALDLAVEIYRDLRPAYLRLLARRAEDRAFVDAGTCACAARNVGRSIRDAEWETVIGWRDAEGRVVVGPPTEAASPAPVSIPSFLRGHQVTLFGPPDSARMAVNAMNALHRQRGDEPPVVARLLEESESLPRWGADSEDSKTPIGDHLLRATEHLAGCFDGTLTWSDVATGRTLRLAERARSIPIKRIPGLALPDGNHLLDGAPMPLHLVELVQHVWRNRERPEAMVLYVPKLENDEEAAYLAALLDATEDAIRAREPCFSTTVRVVLVFENPRAIFRIREMAAALGRHFLGGSLGWHDFLASTARLFRFDPGYRIPVKADPNIVIRHIRESHGILVRDLAPLGAMKIGGMYGVLPVEGDAASLQVSRVGFVKDVVAQLKRGLDGSWVAHPDFVRIGLALFEAWHRHRRDPSDPSLETLIRGLVTDDSEIAPLLEFVHGPDVPGLAADDPRYPRAVLAAELGGSEVIANDHPDEVRYNIFQALQYLADWLSGNGCVALPATMRNARGEVVFVRVMDDLATTERSRWELWAEVFHGRVEVATFDRILGEELAFLRAGVPSGTRRPQVKWEGEAARWYPMAGRLLRQLVVTPDPPEFVTELLLPFTFQPIRGAPDPWAAAQALCPGKYE